MQASSSSPCSTTLSGSNNFCELHHEPHRLFCETCQAPVCSECAIVDHRSHQLIYIQDALESARSNAIKLGNETRAAIVAVREAIDNVQRTSEGIEVRSHQAAGEVRSLVRR